MSKGAFGTAWFEGREHLNLQTKKIEKVIVKMKNNEKYNTFLNIPRKTIGGIFGNHGAGRKESSQVQQGTSDHDAAISGNVKPTSV